MPDFRTTVRSRPEMLMAMEQAKAQAESRNPLLEGIQGAGQGMQSFAKGIETMDAVAKIKKRRQSAEAMTKYLETESGKQFIEDTGLPPEVIKQADPASLVNIQQSVIKGKREGESKAIETKLKEIELKDAERTQEVKDYAYENGEELAIKKFGKTRYNKAFEVKKSAVEQMMEMWGAEMGGGLKQDIRVKVKKSGQIGTIPANEFDPKIYEKL